MDGYRFFPHHVLHFGYGRAGDHFLQREHTAQPLVIVYYIYIIDFVHIFRLDAHFLQTFGHTPVFVYDYHFGTHQSTGSVFVIFQQIDNVSGLFYVFNV